MNLAQKLQAHVKNYNESNNNVVYNQLKRKVTTKLTEAAIQGNEVVIINLVGDGERYWKDTLIEYLNVQGLRATSYSFSESQESIKVTWCD